MCSSIKIAPLHCKMAALNFVLGKSLQKRELSSLGNPENGRGPRGLATFPQLFHKWKIMGLNEVFYSYLAPEMIW